MEGSQRPRRALGPVPDDWNEAADSSSARPAGPLFDDPDELTDTGMMRRLALNADGSLNTLIPPPRPVLPSSETLPASAGRRFSADDAPFVGEWAAPRRSAASVSSPPSAYEPLLPPLSRPTAPPPVTVNYQRASDSPPPPSQLPAATTRFPAVAATAAPPAPTPAPSGGSRSAGSARSQATPPLRAAEPEAAKPTRAEARAAAAEAKAEAKAAKQAQKEAQEAERAAAREAARQAKLDARSERADAKAAKAAPQAPSARSDIAARLGVAAPAEPVTSAAEAAPAAKATAAARSRRPAIIVIAAVLGVVLIVAIAVWALAQHPSGTPISPGANAVDPLLTATDVSPVASGTWQVSNVPGSTLCLGQGLPPAQRSDARKLFTDSNSSVLQTIGTYADDAAATAAYQTASVLAGTCPDDTALVQSASEIKGLGDTAQAVQLQVQGAKVENHLLVLARTGRTLNTFDFVTDGTLPVTTAAQVAATSLNRQCASGTCPAAISVAAALPAPGNPPGWLVPADLPRLTPGTGKWTSHDWPVNTPGSQCEGTDLTKITGTASSGQRTLILTNDPKAPASFGVDQADFTFSDAKPAGTLAASISKSINSCGKRLPTASIETGPTVKGTGTNAAPISGDTWKITHKTNTSTVVFRVAVVTVGNHVTYLLANPSKTFDFTDAQWGAAALRAAQRASQAAS